MNRVAALIRSLERCKNLNFRTCCTRDAAAVGGSSPQIISARRKYREITAHFYFLVDLVRFGRLPPPLPLHLFPSALVVGIRQAKRGRDRKTKSQLPNKTSRIVFDSQRLTMVNPAPFPLPCRRPRAKRRGTGILL